MDARTKASLLWGVIGALAFLVLAQAYLFAAGETVGFEPTVGIAVVVAVAATVTAYVFDGYLH
ncbi:hypothetical protein [Halobacterium litoreum]|uniref:DUF7981 domain-containing protein n=1 Tax=Halobacterium litoreum TaxID=2039234 RepID=A0ABD5NE73_9EURY|nr:hypothetical protein [Halobacterium litoreum]UHH13586.1 hypothetical protein LT972_00985 [Halobacterium litoreum]